MFDFLRHYLLSVVLNFLFRSRDFDNYSFLYVVVFGVCVYIVEFDVSDFI